MLLSPYWRNIQKGCYGTLLIMTVTEFYQRYIRLNLADYENIGIDLQINALILAFTAGIIIASLILGFYRSSVHEVVKQFTRHEAKDEASAKLLVELSLNEWQYIFALKKIPLLKKLIARIDPPAPVKEKEFLQEDVFDPESRPEEETQEEPTSEIDYNCSKFYLVPEQEERCKKVLRSYEPSFISSILFSILILSISVCTIFCTPIFFDFIDSLLGLI